MEKQIIINKIRKDFQLLVDNYGSDIELPDLAGKLFELYTLVDLLKEFKYKYKYTLKIPGGNNNFKFPKKPCKPDKSKFSYIEMKKRNANGKAESYEIWMDIEFSGISQEIYKSIYPTSSLLGKDLRKNFCHELDIAIIKENSNNNRPTYKEICVAVECKDVKEFTKDILKQVIGIRRELSFYFYPLELFQNSITDNQLKSCPPSEFYIYSTNPKVKNLDKVEKVWDLKFRHLRM